MTATTLPIPRSRHRTGGRPRLGRAFATLELWLARQRQRRRLTELTGAELEDIGIARAEALAEARKPFWRT